MKMFNDYKPEFSPEGYKKFLNSIKNSDYKFMFFNNEPKEDDYTVYLRHDVDKSPKLALEMAKIEKDMNIKSTYFFLLHAPLYNLTEDATKTMVRKIKNLGHNIGLHCDERFLKLNDKKSNFEQRVLYEIDLLEKILETEVDNTVSFHNPSAYVKNRKFKNFINTYSPKYFIKDAKYISDSNQNWREKSFPEYLHSKKFNVMQILAHPLWWLDKEEDPIKVLENVYKARIKEIDKYLISSNKLWENNESS